MGKYGQGDTAWFTHDRFGMFIHFGLYALPARHEWIRHAETITNEDYQKYFDNFNPDLFDAKAWAKAAKDAGMKYFVITTKHHEGFCMWDTKYTDYKITNTKFGRDLIREVVDAFRAEGLHIGFYYSLLDWHHPDYVIDDRIGPYRLLSEKDRAKMNKGRDMKRYAKYMRDQVTELLTNYGKIDVLWFDFSYPCKEAPKDATKGKGHLQWESEKLIKLVRKLQPDIIVDNRLDLEGSGDIVTPEQYTPDAGMKDEKGKPVVWEGCQTLSGSWGYFRDEKTWKTPEQCIQMLVNHVSRGGNLLMNVGPTGRGFFDYRATERLNDYAAWMKYNSKAIYGCTSVPDSKKYPAPEDARYTYNKAEKKLYLHLFAMPFHHITLENLGDKIAYAQVLADASEIIVKTPVVKKNPADSLTPDGLPKNSVMLMIPNGWTPFTKVPVIEIVLKKDL